jgi:biopolymer transport protein ExbD
MTAANDDSAQGWGAPIDALALGAMATGLLLLTLGLVVMPQRLAQRPASQGLIRLHLAPDGQLRLWNQPIQADQVIPLLCRLGSTSGHPTVRVVPDAGVPWGSVQQLMGRLGRTDLPLELQLP